MGIKIDRDCLTYKPFSTSCQTAPQTEKHLSTKQRMNVESENMISR